MKRTNRELDQLFEDTMSEIRQERLDETAVKSATDRVWRRLSSDEASSQLGVVPVEHIRGCEDFQTLIPAYIEGYLSSARSMLLEDHTHECIPCRKALKQARAARRGETVAPRTASQKSVTRRAPVLRFAIAAVLIVGVGVVSWPWIQNFTRSVGALNTIVQAANGNVIRISESRTQAVGSGQRLAKGERIRTAKNASAVLKLGDGSTVEMRERSELSVSENSQGTTINLERGQVVVEAAKQGERHLYVATNDSLVSVKGTIFSVNSGTKGSRVSVVEGEVHVDHSNQRSILHAGDQIATHSSIDRVAVKQEVIWSSNAQKYAKVLDDLAALRKEIDAQVARPGVRYSTHLLDLAPENTAIYIAIPNITQMLSEANSILEERVQQNPDLREWWAKEQESRGKANFRSVIDKVSEIGSYLGPEIVLCAEVGANGEPSEPVVLAEVSNPGALETFIRGQLASLNEEGRKIKGVQFVSDPANLPAKASGDGLFIWMKDDVLAASPQPAAISKLAAALKDPEANKFASSPFRAQLAEIYRDGAGLLIAADLQKLVSKSVAKTAAGENTSNEVAFAERLGLLNVKYFIAELKEKDGRSSNRAMLSFTERKGLASWLANPGPMGALEFISPDATAVAAFVAERPVSVVDDLLGALKTAKPEEWEKLKAFETEHGINLRDDVAAPLGGEFAFAIDGPLLPIPAWKAVIEVNDQVRMQQSIEQAISEINQYALSHESKGLSIEHAGSGDRVFHTIKALDASGIEVCYTYSYGYLIAASTRSLVERAIQYHDSGVSLLQSAKFKSTLPEDKQANFSAMLYYNIGPAVTPLMKQGLPVPKKAAVLSLTKPTLAYIYSQGDSFTLSANTEDGPIGLTPSMLMGLPGGFGGLLK
jgi:ferric-dicitrate binding protein FerR (iron transport regulator)